MNSKLNIYHIYEGLKEVREILRMKGTPSNEYESDNDAFMLGCRDTQMRFASMIVADLISEMEHEGVSAEHTDDFKNNPKTIV